MSRLNESDFSWKASRRVNWFHLVLPHWVELKLQVNEFVKAHRYPDVIVSDQVEEVFELESVSGWRPELDYSQPRKTFVSGVSVFWWHDVGLKVFCKAKTNLLVLGTDVILGGILDYQLELEIVLSAQSRQEKEFYSLLLFSVLAVGLNFELVQLVVHDRHLPRHCLLNHVAALEHAEHSCDVICEDNWSSFHRKEVKAIFRSVWLQVLAHVNGLKDGLNCLEVEHALSWVWFLSLWLEDALLLDDICKKRQEVFLEGHTEEAVVLH